MNPGKKRQKAKNWISPEIFIFSLNNYFCFVMVACHKHNTDAEQRTGSKKISVYGIQLYHFGKLSRGALCYDIEVVFRLEFSYCNIKICVFFSIIV